MKEEYIFIGRRKLLVEEIKEKGIKDVNVLNAIGTLPRQLFMDSSFQNHAYKDLPFQIGSGQTISQPYTVALQSELLEVQKGDKILEVGTGSGYQACILSLLGAKVYSIEFQKKLFLKTNRLLERLNFSKIKTFQGDGSVGLAQYAPSDKIVVTAGSPSIPESLVQQLRVGGSMVLPSGE